MLRGRGHRGGNALLLEQEREDVATYARRLEPDGLALGTAGNLSARLGDYVAITPSAVEYDELCAELIVVVDVDGRRVDGAQAPSSELPMHLAIYRSTGAGAVVHTHPPSASALSTVVDELPAIHYLIAEFGGAVRVAPYTTFGTVELARRVTTALSGRNAALLQNHGAVTVGESVASAYDRSLLLEWIAALFLRARSLGEPRLLTSEELDAAAVRLAGRADSRRLGETVSSE